MRNIWKGKLSENFTFFHGGRNCKKRARMAQCQIIRFMIRRSQVRSPVPDIKFLHSSKNLLTFRQNITPFKTVETDNTEVLTASDRSPYWTRWDCDGKPINYVFMVRRRSAKNH